jgi:hypothetical protein
MCQLAAGRCTNLSFRSKEAFRRGTEYTFAHRTQFSILDSMQQQPRDKLFSRPNFKIPHSEGELSESAEDSGAEGAVKGE